MEVLVVLFKMLVEVVDPVSKDSYLNLRGTCIALFYSILFDDEKCEDGGSTPYEEVHRNSPFDNISEAVFTGLRRAEGISFEDALRAYGIGYPGMDASEKFWMIFSDAETEARSYAENGFLIIDDTGLRLTEKGIDLSNGIMSLFV
jgi:coproporphyrinogen III oxidase-like Fe-S oxidoreductase